MLKNLFTIAFLLFVGSVWAQTQPPTREQLEKQRQQLKKELEQAQKLLNENKNDQKKSLLQWRLINEKVNLQNKVVKNINTDIQEMNNNMYTLQKEINLYNRILDTLKREYANSMVYAYKNRNNYDFLNFIFSSKNFNDAVKRITYLRSYRNFREMQGQNIIRTQEQRQKKIDELKKMRTKKAEALEEQKVALNQLAAEEKEKDRILNDLKKQGKQLDKQIAAKKAQMKKVDNEIARVIKKAQEEAKRLAKLKEEEERKKRLAEEKRAKDEAAAQNKTDVAKTTTPATTIPKSTTPTSYDPKPVKPGESVLLNSESMVKLNASFESNKGLLPWPVDRGSVLMPFGTTKLPNGIEIYNTGITIAADIGEPVKSVFNGKVNRVMYIDETALVMVQHGRYFISYYNLKDVTVKEGDEVTTGKVMGKVAANLDGIGSIEFIISDEKNNQNPAIWLRKR